MRQALLVLLFVAGLIAAGCSSDDSDSSDASASDSDGADSSATSPTSTFDGSSCTYDGPDEFDAGSEVTFTLVDTSNTQSVGYAVWTLAPGTTAEEILEKGIDNRGTTLTESAAELTDSGIRLTYLLDEPGLYAANCADRPEGGPAVDYATLFTVSG